MALRAIRISGDEVLRKKAKKVEKIDAAIVTLLNDMADTMYANDGIGLAANQVGVLKRVIVVDDADELLMLVNPCIVSSEGTHCRQEGCLSFPNEYGDVERAAKIIVKALDEKGRRFEFEAEDMLARVIQHEIDHLDGKLFVDKASNLHTHIPGEDAAKESAEGESSDK